MIRVPRKYQIPKHSRGFRPMSSDGVVRHIPGCNYSADSKSGPSQISDLEAFTRRRPTSSDGGFHLCTEQGQSLHVPGNPAKSTPKMPQHALRLATVE